MSRFPIVAYHPIPHIIDDGETVRFNRRDRKDCRDVCSVELVVRQLLKRGVGRRKRRDEREPMTDGEWLWWFSVPVDRRAGVPAVP